MTLQKNIIKYTYIHIIYKNETKKFIKFMNMVTNIKNSTLELYYINLQDTIIYIMSTTIYIYITN